MLQGPQLSIALIRLGLRSDHTYKFIEPFLRPFCLDDGAYDSYNGLSG